jgi:hypothetical protein
MKIRHLPLLLLLVIAPQAATTKPISPEALMKHIRFLASDDLAGRGNGTKGLETAADYIAEQFKAAGLRPGGANGSWFQPLEIVTGLTVGDVNRLSIRSGDRTVLFELGATYYPLSATANNSMRVASAEVSRTPLVFAGYGISAPALNYDDYAGVDVRDKAVIVFTHEPQENNGKSTRDEKSLSQFTTLMNKAMTARNNGARMLIAVSDPTHSADTGAYQGFKRDPQADDYGIPVLRVQRARIAPLLEMWQLDAVAREIDTDLKPRSRPLEGASVDYVEHLAKTRRTVRNVIGILPGTDPARAGEAVIIGAHYDHLGLGGRHSLSPDLAGQIHNGADDNASGTAAIIEIARAAVADRARFPRTTVFVTFAGEELGLLGSTYYVNHPTVPLDRTVAMVNLDMVGRPRGKIMVSGLDAAPTLRAALNAAAAAVPVLEVKQFQEGAGVGSSDDTSFALKRIPSIGFFSGFHSDYHRPTDDWQLIEPTGAASVATLALELASQVSGAERAEYVAPERAAHGPAGNDPGSVGGYGPYFGSVPDFGEQESGVKFAEVRENSPAAKAGLRGGDVMVSFGGKPVKTLVDFTFLLREKKPGDEVDVTVMRDGKPLTVKVLLTTRP